MQSDCLYVYVSSVTMAQKSKYILLKHGYRISIERASNGINGCGYRIKIKNKGKNAVALLKKYSVTTHGTSPCESS